MLIMLPFLVVSFCYAVFTSYYFKKSYERELELIKKLPAAVSVDSSDKIASSSNKMMLFIKLTIVIIAVAVMIYGFIAGGTADVLTKAINICTECIGLG